MIWFFIDTAPCNNEISEKIIKNSDLVVVNLCQNPNTIENFIKNHGEYLDKSLVLLGKYDADSRFNIKKNQGRNST